jgi:hypothetical protein
MTRSGATTSDSGTDGACAAGVSLFVRISGAIDRTHAVYQELDAVSRSQEDLIDRDEGQELLELLARRQVLVDRLTELDRDLTPLRQEWDRSGASAPASQRAHVQSRLAAIADLASWVAHRDSAAVRGLQRRRDALAEELADLGRSKSARSAYGSTPPAGGPRFQDREG